MPSRRNYPLARGVYVHLPFCRSKCHYCDFASEPLTARRVLTDYLDALHEEIRLSEPGPVDTVYFGGGTPSLLTPRQVRGLLDAIQTRGPLLGDAEITLEANPGSGIARRLAGYRRAGVNRISFGVQSTEDDRLRQLGRPHTARQARAAIAAARAAGFRNLSCDLIYGLPGQSLEAFQHDLTTLASWRPDHLSLYALSVEPGTPLARAVGEGHIPAPDEDAAADHYIWARRYLRGLGFRQYELSNFCKPGFACRHNLKYWRQHAYTGFGASACSYRQGVRAWNEPDPAAYLRRLREQEKVEIGSEKLKGRELVAETLIVGLRLTAGLSRTRLADSFGPDWDHEFRAALAEHQARGLLRMNRRTIRLSTGGMLLANVVFRSLL